MIVYYNGAPFAYAHLASMEYAKISNISSDSCTGLDSFLQVVSHSKGENVGVLPVENSLIGPVLNNYISIIQSKKKVIKEIIVPIQHHLFTNSHNSSIESIQTVYSHQKALDQCSEFIQQHTIKGSPKSSTSYAAQWLDENRDNIADSAAICSRQAGEHFNLALLTSDIQNSASNFTRFLVITDSEETPREYNSTYKTTLNCTLTHEPGSLHIFLASLADSGFNLTMIQSYPIPNNPFTYGFIIDVECTSNRVTALHELIHSTQHVQSIGSYQAVDATQF